MNKNGLLQESAAALTARQVTIIYRPISELKLKPRESAPAQPHPDRAHRAQHRELRLQRAGAG